MQRVHCSGGDRNRVEAIGIRCHDIIRGKGLVAPLLVFRGFAGWLVLAPEFLLAADILRTAISSTWNNIWQLAAMATIRTFLNYSLSHDLRHTPDESAPQRCKPVDALPDIWRLGAVAQA